MFHGKISIKRVVLGAFAAAAVSLLLPSAAFAGVVEPSGYVGENSDRPHLDRVNIQNELDATGSVTLKSGETYYLRSTLHVSGNMTIEAEGATIICKGGIARNCDKEYYGALNSLTIHGGTWKFVDTKGYTKSSFQFINAKNIKMSDMKIYCTNYEGHAIELIGCKGVTIDNCDIPAQGKPKKDSVEEMIQMDVAAKETAPTIYQYHKNLINGATCSNVTITNCKIKGNRGVCANKNGDYYNKFHDKITIKNCEITGMSTEALVLYNVKNFTVEKCKLITKKKSSTDNKSSGIHVGIYGSGKLGKFTIKNNTIKGYKQAVLVWSESGSRYKKGTITSNKLYASKKKNTLYIWGVKKLSKKKNKNYKNK
ncbi:MAG: right-handed parallel beta-helix repeat-containing protein [Lachnospiraceae bacterium]|nr:right-handed parallel beta-helix repeat-containing protein [Lachnospiraceae bacterium]